MKLLTPMSGVVIDVADEKAEKYINRGFMPVETSKPVKSSGPKPKLKRATTTRKRTTKKEQ